MPESVWSAWACADKAATETMALKSKREEMTFDISRYGVRKWKCEVEREKLELSCAEPRLAGCYLRVLKGLPLKRDAT